MTGAMVWAIDSIDGSAKHIGEVRTGLGCGCVCSGCRAALEAVNSENPYWKKRPHFRHHKIPETEDCAIASVVIAAKAAFATLDEILLPALEVVAETQASTGNTFREKLREEAVTQKISGYEFVDMTDAILTLANGQKIYVRLVASGVSIESMNSKQSHFAEVVIDISDPILRTADLDVLRRHISINPSSRTWCHHQRLQEMLSSAQKLSEQKAEDHVSAQAKFTLSRTTKANSYRWTSGPIGNHERNVRMQRSRYQEGAFRRHAPPIQYERVLKEAVQARLERRSLVGQIEVWNDEYRLLGSTQPITDVLLAAGIIESTS